MSKMQDLAKSITSLVRRAKQPSADPLNKESWPPLVRVPPSCPLPPPPPRVESKIRKPERVLAAAPRLIEMRAELVELEKHIEKHDREEFTTCETCDSYPVKHAEYFIFCDKWADQLALLVGGMRAMPIPTPTAEPQKCTATWEIGGQPCHCTRDKHDDDNHFWKPSAAKDAKGLS